MRIEKDSFGNIEVPEKVYWGAQTERSLQHFNAGSHKMHECLIRSYGWIKRAAAEINQECGLLDSDIKKFIVIAAQEVADGILMDHFPLRVWQTGSGTQTNMNVNEVIAHRAMELSQQAGKIGLKIHPNDHVNCSQSTNDSFPTAMSLAAVQMLNQKLIPSAQTLLSALKIKAYQWQGVVKVGRTHLMDATPISLGQEFSGYEAQIAEVITYIQQTVPALSQLAIGGTAVGTGLNAPKNFGLLMAERLSKYLGHPFVSASNFFSAISCHDPFVFAHGAVKTLATALIKIATDLSWMVSGPVCGLKELFFEATEPGSSIMAGKVNPTQCEALIMVAVHVYGNDTAIAMAGSRGNFELNVLKPLIIHNFLESVDLLSDSIVLFIHNFLENLQPNYEQLDHNLRHSLMLSTVLIPKIGYDRAGMVAKTALEKRIPLKEAAVSLGFLTAEEYDQWVIPQKMI